jgi:hypothetical protein
MGADAIGTTITAGCSGGTEAWGSRTAATAGVGVVRRRCVTVSEMRGIWVWFVAHAAVQGRKSAVEICMSVCGEVIGVLLGVGVYVCGGGAVVGSRCADVKNVVAVWICIVCAAFVGWMVVVRVDECGEIVGEVDGARGSGLVLGMGLCCTGELAEGVREKRQVGRHE